MPVVDQKKIAKNTALLYVRMIVVLAVGLYSSRVVIRELGDTDFGLFTSVGSIVAMFSFISNTMANACQRFFAYAMGRNDYEEVKRVFSMTLLVFGLIGIIVVLLAEGSGIWLLNNELKLEGRDVACFKVLHISVLATFFTILRIPYQGMIIARERMNLFAYLSFFEAIANLAIAFALKYTHNDKLVLYTWLLMIVQLLITLLYYLYCRICYQECRYSFYYERSMMKKIFSYSGWELLGSFAGSMKAYGVNSLINTFFMANVVSARGVATKVYNSISQLQSNFFTAVKPQITKSYVAGELVEMRKLVSQSTRFTYYLLYIIALPLLLETDFLLDLWLEDVNPLAPLFTRLFLINQLVDMFSNPFNACIQSTGKNKMYQICMSFTLLAIIPLSYIGFKWLGWPAYMVFIVSIVMSVLAQFVRFVFVKRQIGFEGREFLNGVVLVIVGVTLGSAIIPIIVSFLLPEGILNSLLVVALSMLCTSLVVYLIGITKTERKHINEAIVIYYHKYIGKR